MINQEKTAAASYILQYYTEVQNLNDTYAQYINVMTELQETYGKELDKIEENEKAILKQVINNLRYYITKTKIAYNSINLLTKTVKTEVNTIHEKLNKGYVINIKDAEQYVTEINKNLLQDIIKELLSTSQDIINKITK